METLLVGVDVGTGSARAGVLTTRGELLGRSEHPIAMRRLDANRAEHDSSDIWRATCAAVRAALREASVAPESVAGIAFDATCSLVLRGSDGEQLSVSGDEARWDTFVWLDHRAMVEAEECTATGHRVLDYMGGVMSPEMEIPKLMWLKRNRPETWVKLGSAFDLADYLSFRSTGSLARSQSTLASKWNFLAHEADGWPADFLASVGLGDIFERCALPATATPVGSTIGPLTPAAAEELGLTPSCMVGAGLVDAHAGTLGVLAPLLVGPETIDRHLVLVGGTSNSILALAPDCRPMAGVWGPYFGAVLPDHWLSEGGQSAAGALLDHLLGMHSAGGEPTPHLHAKVARRLAELLAAEPHLAPDLHVLPDFHGNRSPLADPAATGAIFGLNLSTGFDSLCRLYWRSAVALALGLRQIIETLGGHGFGTTTLHVTGGHVRSPLLMQLYADVTGCTVVEPAEDPILRGTAIAAAMGCGAFPSLAEAASAMQQPGSSRHADPSLSAPYDRDYRINLELQHLRKTLSKHRIY